MLFALTISTGFALGFVAGWLHDWAFRTFVMNTLPQALTISVGVMLTLGFCLFLLSTISGPSGVDPTNRLLIAVFFAGWVFGFRLERLKKLVR